MKAKSLIIILLMFSSAAELAEGDAYFMPYLVVFALGMFSFVSNSARAKDLIVPHGKAAAYLIHGFSLFFTLFVFLSNYALWDQDYYSLLMRIIKVIALLPGCYCAFLSCFEYIAAKSSVLVWDSKSELKPAKVFLTAFLSICLINCFVLFTANYPGNLTNDNITQLEQIFSGVYSNHHPFYHTALIGLLLRLGLHLFGDINAAIALFSVFQIVFMAACFAFTLMTFSEIGVPKIILIAAAAFFALMPYHIMYSFTMWKDVIFGGTILLLTVSCFRCLNNCGSRIINLIIYFIAGIMTCLFRSNGFFAYIIFFFITALLFGRKHLRLLLLMFAVICASYILKNPVLAAMDVTQPDTIEALSIPAQQIARVICENGTMSDSEQQLISQIIDIESVPGRYVPTVSDDIKELVRAKGMQDYLSAHKAEYLKAYIGIGLKNPWLYIKAWVDQTKGFWNSGYSYQWGIWVDTICENSFGAHKTVFCEPIHSLYGEYNWIFRYVSFLQIFISTGLFVWLDIAALFFSILRRDRLGALLTVPVIAIALSLVIATPVSCEFRYIYSAFCALPAVLVFSARKNI